MGEIDEVREHYADRPGEGHLVEAALGERENAKAQGGDTAGPDRRLADLGWPPKRNRAEAASARKEAAADDGGARKQAPEGRQAPPKETTAGSKAARSEPKGK